MDDLISRQAAINAMETWDKFGCDPDGKLVRYDDDKHYIPYVHYEDMVHAIKHLPSVQQWIPCSERLPEEYGEFLVTMTEKAKAKDLGFDIDETYIRKMRYNSNGWQLPRHIPSWINEAVKDEVLAWMPLPEPYQEEGEKDGKDT